MCSSVCSSVCVAVCVALCVALCAYLVVGQHVESLPVSFDLGADVFVLEDGALASALAPFCQKEQEQG